MIDITGHEAEFLFYSGSDGTVNLSVIFEHETVWLIAKEIKYEIAS